MTDRGSKQVADVYDETILSDPTVTAGERMTLHAERPVLEKRVVRGRLALITRRAVMVRKTFEVELMHEELEVSYEAGDATEILGVEPEAFSILLHAEEVEVVKRVRVVEEVLVSKKRVVEHKQFDVALRHESLDVFDAKRV